MTTRNKFFTLCFLVMLMVFNATFAFTSSLFAAGAIDGVCFLVEKSGDLQESNHIYYGVIISCVASIALSMRLLYMEYQDTLNLSIEGHSIAVCMLLSLNFCTGLMLVIVSSRAVSDTTFCADSGDGYLLAAALSYVTFSGLFGNVGVLLIFNHTKPDNTTLTEPLIPSVEKTTTA